MSKIDMNRPLSEFRVVGAQFADDSVNLMTYIVHQSEADDMIDALIELHVAPGINPHVTDHDSVTSQIVNIYLADMQPCGPYWWTTPGLGHQDREAGNGATLFGQMTGTPVFSLYDMDKYRDRTFPTRDEAVQYLKWDGWIEKDGVQMKGNRRVANIVADGHDQFIIQIDICDDKGIILQRPKFG